MVRDIGAWRPGFYSEFRYESNEHSGLAWGAILKKVIVLTLIARLPCSFLQEQVPKMDSFADVAIRKELGHIYKYIYICIYIYKYIYLTWAPARPPPAEPSRGPCKVYVFVYVYAYVYVYALCTYLDKNIFRVSIHKNLGIAYILEF